MAINYFKYIDDSLRSRMRSKTSKKTYRILLESFLHWLGHKQLMHDTITLYFEELTQKEVKKKINGRTITVPKYKARTLLLKAQAIRSFAEYLYLKDHLSEKEWKLINKFRPAKIDKGEDFSRALTDAEVQRGFNMIADPLLRMMYWVGLHYGLRITAMRRLQTDHVDYLEKKVLTVYKGKGGKTRKISICDEHVDFWKHWFDYRTNFNLNHDYVFFTSRGTPIGNRMMFKYFNKISALILGKPYPEQEEDERITCHDLRRTFATKLLRNECDIFYICKALGHESIKTTMNYLRLEEKEFLDTYRELAAKALRY